MDEESAVRAALDAWPPSDPPGGFSARVVARAARDEQPKLRPSPRRRCLIGGAAMSAAMLAAFLFFQPAEGHAEPVARETVRLGSRAVAVAEAGASLRWSVERFGTARVEQEGGDVFYRVEPGGAFVVSAHGVEVTVRGTCFRVEEPMNVKGKVAIGAAGVAAVAVLITVYEGSVEVRGEAGTTTVAAGERVEASASHATVKTRALTPAPALADAMATTPKTVAQIAALQERVRELEQTRASLQSQLDAQPHTHVSTASPSAKDAPTGLPTPYKTHDFTAAELEAMARACEVRFDAPPLGYEPWKMSASLAAEHQLSVDQQAQVTAEINRVRSESIAALRALYTQVSGDSAGAYNLSPATLGQEIIQKSPPQDEAAARAKISAERAGLATPPADPNQGTSPERYYRLMGRLGDSVQQALTPIVGAQKAPALRDAIDGAHSAMNGCEDAPRSP